jgi:DNA-directed RNA polymerase specialized sigma24 family protein
VRYDLEDLAQECRLKLLLVGSRYSADRGASRSTWEYVVAANHLKDVLKRMKRMSRESPADYAQPSFPHPKGSLCWSGIARKDVCKLLLLLDGDAREFMESLLRGEGRVSIGRARRHAKEIREAAELLGLTYEDLRACLL